MWSVIAFAFLFPSLALAGPFVVSDSYVAPSVIPDRFRVTLDGGAEVVVLPWSGVIAGVTYTNVPHFDLVGLPVGAHIVSAKACKGDLLWGQEVCSAATPFSFTKPVPPGAPPPGLTGMSLAR